MKKLNSKGFSAVEAILVIVIVGIVAGVGWFVWHARNQANSTYSNINNTQNTNSGATAIKTFADCQKSPGSKTSDAYPEVCTTKYGKKFPNPNQKPLSKTYTSPDYGFSFKYPDNWTLSEKLSDIGRGGKEGDITVTSPSGTIVHFGPNFGGKGGDCLDDQANDTHTTRTCVTRNIYTVTKLATANSQIVYLVYASDTDPLDAGGKTHFFVYLSSGYDTPRVGSTLGAFLGPYDDIWIHDAKTANNFVDLTVYVEGKDDKNNNSKEFFDSPEIKEALPVLESFQIK